MRFKCRLFFYGMYKKRYIKKVIKDLTEQNIIQISNYEKKMTTISN